MPVIDYHALATSFFGSQDARRGGPDPALCAEGYVARIGGFPEMDLAGHTAFARAFYGAFADAAHTLETAFGSGDHLAVRFHLAGTHTGDYFGLAPTGRAFRVAANVLIDLRDGRVARVLGVFDEAGLLRQLGVLHS